MRESNIKEKYKECKNSINRADASEIEKYFGITAFGVTCSELTGAGQGEESGSDTDPLDSSWGFEHSSSTSDVISVDNKQQSYIKPHYLISTHTNLHISMLLLSYYLTSYPLNIVLYMHTLYKPSGSRKIFLYNVNISLVEQIYGTSTLEAGSGVRRATPAFLHEGYKA